MNIYKSLNRYGELAIKVRNESLFFPNWYAQNTLLSRGSLSLEITRQIKIKYQERKSIGKYLFGNIGIETALIAINVIVCVYEKP